MGDVILKSEARRLTRMALCLREVEYVLQCVTEGTLPDEERSPEAMGRRQDRLLAIARELEAAVRDATPQTPPPVRISHSRPKQVWCNRKGCERVLTREQARVSGTCLVCRLEEEKQAAAK